MPRHLMAAAALSATLAGHAYAQGTGSDGYFEIHNDTVGHLVTGFYTNDGSGWSDNWLDDTLALDESVVVEFIADTGSCAQTLRVGWLADDEQSEVLDDPINIDICDASNVYLGDNNITYD